DGIRYLIVTGVQTCALPIYEIQSKSARGQVDIVPANYSFIYLGTAACADRKCYRLGITPRRQEKYLIQGEICVDAEDWGIVRVRSEERRVGKECICRGVSAL